MNTYLKELIILFIQIIMFYIFPLFAGPTDAMGMVVIIITVTFILSIVLSIISNNRIKYLYPIIISVTFIPSVFIYSNFSAFIHSIWYFAISVVGIIIGLCIKNIKMLR